MMYAFQRPHIAWCTSRFVQKLFQDFSGKGGNIHADAYRARWFYSLFYSLQNEVTVLRRHRDLTRKVQRKCILRMKCNCIKTRTDSHALLAALARMAEELDLTLLIAVKMGKLLFSVYTQPNIINYRVHVKFPFPKIKEIKQLSKCCRLEYSVTKESQCCEKSQTDQTGYNINLKICYNLAM
jgi:hypothetical protein